MSLEKLKKIGREYNSPVMETYVPVSPAEVEFWNMHKNVNQHLVVDYKKVSKPTEDDALFKGNTKSLQGKRPADKKIDTQDKPKATPYVESVEVDEVNLAYSVGKGGMQTVDGDKTKKKVFQTFSKKKAANSNAHLKLVKNEETEVVESSFGFKRTERISKSANKALKKSFDGKTYDSDNPIYKAKEAQNRKFTLKKKFKRTQKEDVEVQNEDLTPFQNRVAKSAYKAVQANEGSLKDPRKKEVKQSYKKSSSDKEQKTYRDDGHNLSSDVKKVYKFHRKHNAMIAKHALDTAKGDVYFNREETELREFSDLSLARLRVRRSKIKKKLEKDSHSVSLANELSRVMAQIKNLTRANKARDAWASSAEKEI